MGSSRQVVRAEFLMVFGLLGTQDSVLLDEPISVGICGTHEKETLDGTYS
jgi:hypothetical protein